MVSLTYVVFNGKLECIPRNVRLLSHGETSFLKCSREIVRKWWDSDGIVYTEKKKKCRSRPKSSARKENFVHRLAKAISFKDETE